MQEKKSKSQESIIEHNTHSNGSPNTYTTGNLFRCSARKKNIYVYKDQTQFNKLNDGYFYLFDPIDFIANLELTMAYQYSHLPHGLPQYLPPGCKFLSCHDAQNVLQSCSTWRLPNGTLVTPLGGELYQVVEVPTNCDERCSLHQVCYSLDVPI